MKIAIENMGMTQIQRIRGKLFDEVLEADWHMHTRLIEGRLTKIFRAPKSNKAVRQLRLIRRIQQSYTKTLIRHAFFL
jgi:hypothetical protein